MVLKMLKNKTCSFCGASFVPEYNRQIYCNECLKLKKVKNKLRGKYGTKTN